MRELMLELLTYEPYGKLSAEEEAYISEILAENYRQPISMLHDLFFGFCDYVWIGDFKDIHWLQSWKNQYHQNKNYTNSTKSGRSYYPLLFKKICFYILVRADFKDKEFMEEIGLSVSLIRKWKISAQFRRFAEADTYSVIRSFRSGVKKPYIVSHIKKLYHEAGRQVSRSTTLKELPRFVDVFVGTAGVAASVVSDGCPPPIVNDYDPVMICFAWAFTYYQKELRSRLATFINDLMKAPYDPSKLSYKESDYKRHYGSLYALEKRKPGESFADRFMAYWQKEANASLRFWENRELLQEGSKASIQKGKERVLHHREFIIKLRSSYLSIKNILDECDRNALRQTDFNALPRHMSSPQKDPLIEDILDYALASFYYYSFSPSGKTGNAFHVSSVDERTYISFLSKMKVDVSRLEGKNRADKAWALKKLKLYPASLKLERTGGFSRHMKDAEFYSKDFRQILRGAPSDRVYYLDSPYFLTTGYDVGFSDDEHKAMLDLLRNAAFKWIFSMQYNPSARSECTNAPDEAKRKKNAHIIRDYGAYYRGFYAPLELDAGRRFYTPGAPAQDASTLFAILIDVSEAKKKWPRMNEDTQEMLVVNFNCLRVIPLHDTAVVLPFSLFLQHADAGSEYHEIVQAAIAWRKDNIARHHTEGEPV